MKLLTKSIEAKLLKNGKNAGKDHAPVVKFFNPCGNQTWLFSEMSDDGDTLFGLCDLGFGFAELGYASLSEMTEFKGILGLGIERDMYFSTNLPMSHYVTEANAAGRIVA